MGVTFFSANFLRGAYAAHDYLMPANRRFF
ncbi:MAG: hypothetical protein JWQ28_335, partial [Pedobacter sp.]|nr:hypothetical protein [Pedobacter sp.]